MTWLAHRARNHAARTAHGSEAHVGLRAARRPPRARGVQ